MLKASAPIGECEIAEDGVQAVEMFRGALADQPYDLVLMDVMMPKMTGLDAIEQIREIERQNYIPQESQVHIVVVTALDDSVTYEQATFSGADAYLVKPLKVEQFQAVIRSLGIA